MLTRRGVLGVLAAGIAAPILPFPHRRRQASPAGGMVLPLMQNAYTVHKLNQAYPPLAAHFFDTPASFGTGGGPGDPVLDGFATTPVLRYTSCAQFQADLAAAAIPSATWPAGSWVLYDNENWTQTPQGEIDDPWTFMAQFAQAAHNAGYNAATSPARDLGNDPTSVNPKQQGETLDGWYLRTGVASAAAACDLLVVQTQVDTTSPAAYAALFNGAQAQAAAVNASCRVFAEVSHNYGTPGQAYTAATGVQATGLFVSGANDAASLAWEADLLSMFQAAGY